MKKILIFSFAYYPKVGGAEVAVKEITDRINDISFDMITFKFSDNDSSCETIGNINVYRINSYNKYLYPFFAYTKACTLNKKNKYDLSWSIMANYAGFAALFFKFRFKTIPFVLTLQEGDPINYIKRRVLFVYPIFKMIFIKADKITAISNYLAKFGKNMGHKKFISIIPNGVDVDFFLRPIRWPRWDRKEKKLFTAGRLVRKNGVDLIISSLTNLPPLVKLIIVGDGPDKNILKKLAYNLGVEKRVTFIGFKTHQYLIDYMDDGDIFIRPSRSEGLGNVFLEAMMAGLPVVATSVGGIPDLITDGETGFFCKEDSPDSISKKVEYILDKSNNSKIERVINTAQSIAKEKYNWSVISSNMSSIFKKAL